MLGRYLFKLQSTKELQFVKFCVSVVYGFWGHARNICSRSVFENTDKVTLTFEMQVL